jgi:hypothetical protein
MRLTYFLLGRGRGPPKARSERQRCWHGVYARSPDSLDPVLTDDPLPPSRCVCYGDTELGGMPENLAKAQHYREQAEHLRALAALDENLQTREALLAVARATTVFQQSI